MATNQNQNFIDYNDSQSGNPIRMSGIKWFGYILLEIQ